MRRRRLVAEELQLVRHRKRDMKFVESTVVQSAAAGGRTRILRKDLMEELRSELVYSDRKIRLCAVSGAMWFVWSL